jgi:hypothetical protein
MFKTDLPFVPTFVRIMLAACLLAGLVADVMAPSTPWEAEHQLARDYDLRFEGNTIVVYQSLGPRDRERVEKLGRLARGDDLVIVTQR